MVWRANRMRPIIDWLMWLFVAAVLVISYPLLRINRKDDDDDL